MTLTQFIVPFLLGGWLIGGIIFVNFFVLFIIGKDAGIFSRLVFMIIWPLLVVRVFIREFKRDPKN